MALTGREMRPCWPQKVAVCKAGDTAENTTDDVGEITENTKGAVLMQTADQQSAVGDKIQEIGDKVLNVYMDEVEENGRR